MSHKKNLFTFHDTDTGCLIGILMMAYLNPYTTGYALYTLNNQGPFFIAQNGQTS